MASARWLVFALGVATFLAAAKTHGRQVRLERELAGYWHVTFGAQNPPFVETLWRRERLLYWAIVVVVAFGTVGFRLLAPRFAWWLPIEGAPSGRSFIGAVFLHVLAPLTVAFVATGLLSLARFASAARAGMSVTGEHPQGWLSQAAWGSAGWWFLTIAMAAALSIFAWRR
jgi:hypothetical protein